MLRLKPSKKDIVTICRQMHLKGFICATDGNASIRFQKKEILVTPTGVHKGFLSERDIIIIDINGEIISGEKKPSSEILMHLEIYRRNPEIEAVLHAHPPLCTAFSLAKKTLPTDWLPEVYITFGKKIPVVPYATPSTKEVPDAIAEYVSQYHALILERHGTVTMGKTLWEAYYKLEKMEHLAQVILYAEQLGQPGPMNKQHLKLLDRIRGE